ncbi:MAG TPA: ABC transporter permease [Candidatus Acidoferrum sp.]|nr:ABC transporter permease [Candidatus Acidoferrum sp.]
MMWLNQLFSRRRLYNDLSEEIREHLGEKIEDLVAGGMSRKEATHAARREFGNVRLTEEDSRAVWRWAAIEDFFMDVRFGARMLRKNPGFAAVAIVTLALGIAANATIFTMVSGWMLRPPRIKDHTGVVVILSTNPAKAKEYGWDQNPVSVPDFVVWREQSHSFEDMVASQLSDFALTGEGEPERFEGMRVSASYFDVLGVPPALGRTFLPGEDQPGHDQVVILSDGLWQRRFGSNPKVVGEAVRLNGNSYKVVGIMPKGHRLGYYGPQMWTPLVFPPQSLLPAARDDRSLDVMARLKSGVSVETAKAEMAALAQRSEQTYPGTNKGWGATAWPIQKYLADEFKVAMRLLMGTAIFVLLIACANIASLQLTRAAARQREFAVRVALGASRFRLVRQLLVESLLVALAGGGLGLLLASWGVALLRGALNWSDYVTSLSGEVTLDNTVLAFTLGASVCAAILFGLAPALHGTALDLHSTLKEGGRAGSQSTARNRTHSVLVTAEITLALALLIGAGLDIQDLLHTLYAGFGIDPNQVLTANISLSSTRYKEPSKQADFFKNVVQHLDALPGVISAGATTTLVPSATEPERAVTFSIAGQPVLLRTAREQTAYYAISSDYLRTQRIPLLRGRSFLPTDNVQAPPVALVNQAFVQRYFPNEEPLGKRVRLDTTASDRADWTEIVGVVGDVKDLARERKDMSQVYEPSLQRPSPGMTLVVRTRSDPTAFAPMLRRAVWDVDEDQPITRVQTMNQVIADYRTGGVTVCTMMGTFAGLALGLAVIGVFGVMAYTVAQRTHEMGIRMALGAKRSDVLRIVLMKGIFLGAIGVAIGLGLGASLMWLQQASEGVVMPFDQRAPVYLAAVFLISLTVLLATYVPARRATKVDPIVALRHE